MTKTNSKAKTPYKKVDKTTVHPRLEEHCDKFCAYKFAPRKGQTGKFDKIPIDGRGYNKAASNKTAQVKLVSAIRRANKFDGGVSLPMNIHTDLMCLDLDGCVDENRVVDEWAQKIVEDYNSYTEFSPSGTGLHIWIKGVEGLE